MISARTIDNIAAGSEPRAAKRAPRRSADPASACLRLQSRAGNAAVARLLKSSSIQRQHDATPAEADGELATVLDRIARAMASAQVPPYEVIAGTTAGEYSRGEFEGAIADAWRRERLDFTEAARRIARENTSGEGAPRPTQSPHIPSPDGYALRWNVGLYAADYRGRRDDRPEIAALMRKGSPFQLALGGGFDRAIPVPDPTAAEIKGSVIGAVIDMWAELRPGAMGEIVVFFSGHGGGGQLVGVDGEWLTLNDLRKLAEFAADYDVHLVYVLDTCRAGTLAQYAQATAIEQQVQRPLTDLPPARRAAIEPLARFVEDLNSCSLVLGDRALYVGNAAATYRRRPDDANRLELVNALTSLGAASNDVYKQIGPGRVPPGGPDTAQLLDQLRRLDGALLASYFAGRHESRDAASTVLRRTAVVLDELGDLINDLISRLRREISAAESGTGAGR